MSTVVIIIIAVALARRLHVSPSTLHRYCSGDAVAAEFAPVDRFARLKHRREDVIVRQALNELDNACRQCTPPLNLVQQPVDLAPLGERPR